MGGVTGDGLVQDAIAELYSSDPDKFVARRGILVTAARAAGEASAAKRIGALGKPTRSAWVLNQLSRSAPDAAGRLTALGGELRAAQRSLDGPAIRELSVRRRQLIDELARQAFAVCGQRSPAAGLREEVTATLAAALADPQVAEQLRAGALERVVRRDGFVQAEGTVLALVPSPSGRRRPGVAQKTATPSRLGAKVTTLAPARARAEREQRRAIAAAERERRATIAEAARGVAEAERTQDAAERAERKQESVVQLLDERLADARQALAEARLQAQRARTRHRQAQRALDRLRK
jgi:hypothetical protein